MFVSTIILGFSLYPGYCYKANNAFSTRSQSRNSQLYYSSSNYRPSQDIYYNYEAKLKNNYNYEPSQNSNYNYEPNQNHNYNYAPSRNSNQNYVSSQNSSHNYAPTQNGNNNYVPSPNGNNNYVPSQNRNYNYDPSQNSNNNYYAPSQNSNQNNKLNFNSYGNVTYAGVGLYGVQRIPSDRLVYLNKVISSQPYENERYNSQLDELSRDRQTIRDGYRYSTAFNAGIGGRPVPMFSEYPEFHSDLPPVNVTPYPKLPSTPIPFPPFENSQNEKVGFGHIESRFNNMTATAASPDVLGFDDNPETRGIVERERFLWQVSVFSKEVSPRVRVCGGSLVTSSAVISAARCFWSVGPLSAELFAVAAGEAASGQANNYEANHYRRNVRDIRLPPRFRGAASSFQDDLAVVVLVRPLPPALKPVCVSFDWELEQQLAESGEGMVLEKVGKWNLDMRNQQVPYISVEECLEAVPEDQLRYVTSDKFCAGIRGVKDDRVCSPDTGSGLVYFQGSSSIPFLRGVVSLPLGDSCVTAFTHVATHRAFLLRHLSGLEAECARRYPGARGAVKEGRGDMFVCNCYC